MTEPFKSVDKSESLAKAERAVLRAAMGCVDKNGHAFKFAKADVNYYVIDRAKWQRLEAAVAKLRDARK